MAIKSQNHMADAAVLISGKAEAFVAAAGASVMSHSRKFAPLAYGRLVNSQRQTIVKEGAGKIVNIVGYDVEYARYLEYGRNWKPKPPPKYGNQRKGIPKANAWNPNAKPGFLQLGVTDAQQDIEQLKNIFLLG